MCRLSIVFTLLAPCLTGASVVELAGPRVSAAAVFPGADSDADLGPAPAPGVRRRVTHSQLLRWARQAGIDVERAVVPDELTLVRKLRSLDEAEAEGLAQSVLAAEIGEGMVEVHLEGYAPREIPAGRLEWSLAGGPPTLGPAVRIGLRWRDGGSRSGVEFVMARVVVRTRALVARRALPSGAAVSPADFALEPIERADLRADYLTRIPPGALLSLEDDLEAGEPLREDLVGRRPLVEPGALLELSTVIGAVRLRAPARAEGRGFAGDLVPLRNLATNQRVVARIVSAQAAEVTPR